MKQFPSLHDISSCHHFMVSDTGKDGLISHFFLLIERLYCYLLQIKITILPFSVYSTNYIDLSSSGMLLF